MENKPTSRLFLAAGFVGMFIASLISSTMSEQLGNTPLAKASSATIMAAIAYLIHDPIKKVIDKIEKK